MRLRIPFPLLLYTVVSSAFGPRWGKFHNGVDFACPVGTDIRLPFDGFVAYVQYDDDGYGHYVVVEFPILGICMLFAHLKPDHGIKLNQQFKAGDFFRGVTGNSGSSTGPHLHVEIRLCEYGPHFWDNDPAIYKKKTYSVDPMWFFYDPDLTVDEIMEETLDSPESWKEFFQAAIKIRELAPWLEQFTKDVYYVRKE